MEGDWPFDDPPNIAAIRAAHVILLATHHEEDGARTFMGGAPFAVEDGFVVDLAHMVRGGPTLRDLSDLSLG